MQDSSNQNWRGERLTHLAQISALSLSQLANELEMSASQLSKIANAQRRLTTPLVLKACKKFSLPTSFFTVIPYRQDSAAVTFLKQSTTSARQEKQVTALFSEAARLWHEASQQSGYITCNLPDAQQASDDVEYAAQLIREKDNKDDIQPIKNMTRLAERLGIGVINNLTTINNTNSFSGLCRPSKFDQRPLIATIANQSGATQRLTIAHEIAHLIYDTDLATPPTRRSKQEQRAFKLATALLLPAPMMKQRVSETLKLNAYLRIKADYGVSVNAIIKRAQHLGLISHERARILYIQHNSAGWRTNEPVPVANENPLLLKQAIQHAWPQGTNQASQQTGIALNLINQWANQNTPTSDQPETNAPIISITTWKQNKTRNTTS